MLLTVSSPIDFVSWHYISWNWEPTYTYNAVLYSIMHLANFTTCQHIMPRTTLQTMQWQLRINLSYHMLIQFSWDLILMPSHNHSVMFWLRSAKKLPRSTLSLPFKSKVKLFQKTIKQSNFWNLENYVVSA